MSKETIRKQLRLCRKNLTQEQIFSLSRIVFQFVTTLRVYQEASSIGLYFPIDNEVDTALLFENAHCLGKKVYVPVVDKSSSALRFVLISPDAQLQSGAFGILEPLHREELLDPWHSSGLEALDLLFVPLLGFDRQGGRLGFGGGYYDRALAAGLKMGANGLNRPLLVGLAYHFQEVDQLPSEPHDILLNLVVSTSGVYRI
ncbi:MAG: 5-formyltetrahydrofolate cyclo-ligase [Magnetococcus sp. DMHC-6]